MAYRVRIDPVAQQHIDEFAAYLRRYDEGFAVEQIERLDRISRSTWARRRSRGITSPSPALRTGPICFASDGERSTG
jgi:hypothetical protein